jgi:hypothetical protein
MVNTGYKQDVAWGNETSYGSAAAITQSVGIVQSINPTETNNLIKLRTLGGNRDYSNIVPGKFEISGSMEYYLQGCAFLRQAIGEDTADTSTVDSGATAYGSSYLHIMGSADSPLVDSFPSFTLEFADSEDAGGVDSVNLKRLYTGCRVNSMTINGSVDDPVTVSIDWLAKGVTVSSAAATVVADSTNDPYVFYQGGVYATSANITNDTTQAALADDAIAEINNFSVTVNNNAEAKWYWAGTQNSTDTLRGAKFIIPKGRDYEASLSLDFKNKAMYQRFLGSNAATEGGGATLSKYQIAIDMVRQGTIGTTTGEPDYVRIVLASCAFNDISITGAPENIVGEEISVAVKKAKFYVVDDDADYTA